MTEIRARQGTLRSDISFAFALALAAYVAWLVRGVLVLVYISGLFAVVLVPVVNATSRIHIGRWRLLKGPAILLLLAMAAGAATAFGFLAIPPVLRDLAQLNGQAPTSIPELLEKVRRIPFVSRLNEAALSSDLVGFATHATTYVLFSIKDWAGKLANIVSGLVLTVYFILEGERTYRWFLSFVPPDRRPRLDDTLQRAGVRMRKWLLGQASLMLILGVTSTITYLALDVRYAYALGALTGLLNIIPMVGAAIAIVLALLVAAIDSWGRVVGVAIFYAIYLQVENSYLTPKIMQARVALSGLATLVSLLLGFALAGVPGALVAIPTAVLVSVLLDEYLVRNH
jgi:predicted PurR-regulated permease PerM